MVQCGPASRDGLPALEEGPVARPDAWLQHVNPAQTEADVKALRECIRRRRPFGYTEWAEKTALQFGLEASLRPAGRPRKKTEEPPALSGRGAEQE